MWHVSSCSGVATLRTAIHLLLTYLLPYLQHEGLDPRMHRLQTTAEDTALQPLV